MADPRSDFLEHIRLVHFALATLSLALAVAHVPLESPSQAAAELGSLRKTLARVEDMSPTTFVDLILQTKTYGATPPKPTAMFDGFVLQLPIADKVHRLYLPISDTVVVVPTGARDAPPPLAGMPGTPIPMGRIQAGSIFPTYDAARRFWDYYHSVVVCRLLPDVIEPTSSQTLESVGLALGLTPSSVVYHPVASSVSPFVSRDDHTPASLNTLLGIGSHVTVTGFPRLGFGKYDSACRKAQLLVYFSEHPSPYQALQTTQAKSAGYLRAFVVARVPTASSVEDDVAIEVPITAEVKPANLRFVGADSPAGATLANAFPDLHSASHRIPSVALDELQAELDARAAEDRGAPIDIFGVAIPKVALRWVGTLAVCIVQLYLLLHMNEFRRRYPDARDATLPPWIGCYKGAASIGMTLLTILALPIIAQSFIAVRLPYVWYVTLPITATLGVLGFGSARMLRQSVSVAGAPLTDAMV